MLARSTASADRPFIGRSAAAVFGLLMALIASMAIGAAAARASADSQVAEQASETDQSATDTVSLPAAGAPAAPAQSTAQTEPPAPAFAVVELAAVPGARETSDEAMAATDALTSAGVIEIELPQGARVRISGEVAPAVVTAALRALMRR